MQFKMGVWVVVRKSMVFGKNSHTAGSFGAAPLKKKYQKMLIFALDANSTLSRQNKNFKSRVI